MKRLFHIATDEEVKGGRSVDIYYVRTKQILDAKGLDKVRVVMEFSTGDLPRNWPWGILCGVEEEAHLLEGYPFNVYSMPEGSVFYARDYGGLREPVLIVEGSYSKLAPLETAAIGLLCQASGVATAAARIRKILGFEKFIASFGIRRMHPSIAPMIDRAAYIGGFDGVSGVLGAELIGMSPVGTMPHPLIIVMGGQVEAWRAFDEVMPEEVPRICLVDTFYDEKTESLMAAEALGDKLYGVRLDTPGSRKGDFAEIIREVRWELDLRGYRKVKIMVSGGINDENVKKLSEAGAEAFGVGTWVSNAPTIDFGGDLVEVEGKPMAKRGKLAGMKQVWRCRECLTDKILPFKSPAPQCPRCGGRTEGMLKPLLLNGEIVAKIPTPMETRSYVIEQLKKLPPL